MTEGSPGDDNVIQMSPPAKKKVSVPLTDEIKNLDSQLVQAFSDAEEINLRLIDIVGQCVDRSIHSAFMMKGMSEYLTDRLKIGTRQAQYLLRTAEAFRRTGLPIEKFKELGSTKSRDIATYALKANASKAEIEQLIGDCQDNKWTSDRLQQEVRKRLTEKGILTKGIGSDPDEEPLVRAHFMVTPSSKAVIEEHLEEISKRTGTKNPGKNLEMALAEAVGAPLDSPSSAFNQIRSHSDALITALEAVANQMDGVAPAARNNLCREVNLQILKTIIRSGSFISHDMLDDEAFDDDEAEWNESSMMVVVDIIKALCIAMGWDGEDVDHMLQALKEGSEL